MQRLPDRQYLQGVLGVRVPFRFGGCCLLDPLFVLQYLLASLRPIVIPQRLHLPERLDAPAAPWRYALELHQLSFFFFLLSWFRFWREFFLGFYST